MRECLEHGCPRLIPRNKERCEDHARKQQVAEDTARAVREPWRKFYADKRYRGASGAVKRRAGFSCQRIIDGRRCNGTHGLDAHHVRKPRHVYEDAIALGLSPAAALRIVEEMFFDPREMRAVCGTCHPELDAELDRLRREERSQ